MDTKKEAKKYLNKYFKSQYINENDDEYKSLVRLINKAQKQVKNCNTPDVSNQREQLIAFLEWAEKEKYNVTPYKEQIVNDYLKAINCC